MDIVAWTWAAKDVMAAADKAAEEAYAAAIAAGTHATCGRCKGDGFWAKGRVCFKCQGQGVVDSPATVRAANAARAAATRAFAANAAEVVAQYAAAAAEVVPAPKRRLGRAANPAAQVAEAARVLSALEVLAAA